MTTISVSNILVNGADNDADDVNQNFSDLESYMNTNVILKDGSKGFDTVPSPMGDAWTSYSPVLGGTTSDPTLGSGNVVSAYYLRVGKTIHYKGRITFGTTSFNLGSGFYKIPVPVNMNTHSSANIVSLGTGVYFDASGPGFRSLTAMMTYSPVVNSYFYLLANSSNDIVGSNSWVVTPGQSDEIWWNVTYETA